MKFHRLAVAVVLIGAMAPLSTKAFAQSTTSRLALVIGEAQYRDAPLTTAANDGGLMADLLRQAGYDVTGAANLSQDQIRSSFREFLEKVAAVGPRAEVFVYMSGKGLQFAGENYLAPIEATIANSASVPAEAVRLSDFIGPLEGMPAQARVIVLDIARPNNFGRTGEPLASGLAIVDAPPNTLVAFNAAPGTIAPDEPGPYGAYARSLAEMLRQPGLPLNDAFAQVRLRVNEATRGGQTPWNVTKLSASMALFAPAAGAPAVAPLPRARRPMREVSPQEAYGYAVEADTFAAYNDFLAAYPNDPLARRVRVMLAARREAITWRRTYVANTPDAYWTYLQRYPRGPHAADAARRLNYLSAPVAPPPSFRVYDDYDVPPPPPDEIVIVDRRRFYVNEIVDVPPPRYADDFLPPVPVMYRDIPPPPPPPPMGFLPIPVPIPIPFARPQGPPGMVVPPRFVQQPVPPPSGGGAAPPPRVPQGYTPLPPQPPGVPGRPGMPPVPPPGMQPGGTPGGPPIAPRPAGPPGTPGTMQPGGNPSGAPPSQTLPRPGGPGQPPVMQPGGNPSGTPPGATPPRPATPGQPPVVQPGGSPPGGPAGATPPRPATPGQPPVVSPGGSPPGAPPRPGTPAPEASPAAPPSPPPQTLPRPVPGGAPDAPRTPPRVAPVDGHTAPVAPAPPKPAAPPPPAAAPVAPRAAPVDRGPGAPPREPPAQPRPAPHLDAPRPAAPPPHMDAPRAPPPAMPRPVAPPPPAAMPHPAAPLPPAAMPRPSAPPPAAMPHPAAPQPGMPRPGGPGGHAPGAPHEGGPGR